MGIVLGIDIGSSATKIVAMDESKTILNSLKVSASDPVTAMYGAVGKILCEERMQIADVEAVMLTGMGASYVEGDVYGLPTRKVTEFDALGTGGLYLTGLEETVVGSIGTGTVFVHAGPDGIQHIGGSAVGGGTLVGLSSRLFGIRDVGSDCGYGRAGQSEECGLGHCRTEQRPDGDIAGLCHILQFG